MSDPKHDILIVDDTPANLRVLSRLLSDNGYKVRPVPSGAHAIEAVGASRPDLIFLDIRMPEMDGYEVCRRLKADEKTRDIPVIFISALNELEDKVQGFEAGAVDFITKPFQEGEVLVRLSTHLTIRDQRRQIAEQLESLRRLETLRENLTQMIVHDLNNPLHGILGLVQLIQIELSAMDGQPAQKYARSIESSVRSTIDMIRAILDLGKIESGDMQISPEDVVANEFFAGVSEGIAPLLSDKHLDLEVRCDTGTETVRMDRELMRRVMVNLIGNAIKFSPDNGTIGVEVTISSDNLVIRVTDEGPGIPPKYHELIFEKYGQVESAQSGRKYATGLGLAFCKLAVEAHAGTIMVDSREGAGSTFIVTIPNRDPNT